MKNFVLLILSGLAFSLPTLAQTSSENHRPQAKDLAGALPGPLGPVEGYLSWSNDKRLPHSGFTELLPYILPSPDQEDAGSCLYMATTGIVEWWLAKLNPQLPMTLDGPIDLSERYTMNMAGLDESQQEVKNWRTDTILAFNIQRQGVLNSHYRYTKGFYKETPDGELVPASENEEGSQYGPYYNWINEIISIQEGHINLPKFKRSIIFADSEHNQWNTDVAPKDAVEQLKLALEMEKAPILIMYNHYGYWHAVMVVGFNDEATTECKFTAEFPAYMMKKSDTFLSEAQQSSEQEERERLIKRAMAYRNYATKAKNRYEREGGCAGKGVFYVRDSIYPDEHGPLYDYDLMKAGEEGPYSKKIILREYEWVKTLANHAIQVTLDQ